MKRLALLLPLFALPCLAQNTQQWVLDSSTLTYHVTHAVHEAEGTTHSALGKGVCTAGQCDFLVAAQVKSFDSGDSNRDLHMLQIVRGAQFPIVSVRLRLPQSALGQPTLDADMDVTFAGQTAHYSHIALQQVVQNNEHRISGTLPTTLTDFKIDPPSFLAMPLHNEMPVRFELYWHPAN